MISFYKYSFLALILCLHQGEKFSIEPSLLAVLIRLMSYILPYTPILSRKDLSVANRFSTMVAIMIEASRFHATVVFEGVAFYDRLCSYTNLLSRKSLKIHTLEKTLPIIVNVLGSHRKHTIVHYNHLAVCGFDKSIVSRKAVSMFFRKNLNFLKVTGSLILIEQQVKTDLFALLEYTSGSRQYCLAPYFRNLAAPAASERFSMDGMVLEQLLLTELESMFYLDLTVSGAGQNELHWLLFMKCLMSNEIDSSEVSGSDTQRESLVINIAEQIAKNDALALLAHCSNIRWQIKQQVLKFAYMSLLALYSRNEENKALDGGRLHQFDLSKARVDVRGNKLTQESSLVFHIEGLMSSACAMTIATADQGELRTLQNSGVIFLTLLIECFDEIADPDEESSKTMLLEKFSSQIIPSVKHALSSRIGLEDDSITNESTDVLFMSGCRALSTLIMSGLISDSSFLTRIAKHVFPSRDELPISAYPSSPKGESGMYPKLKSFVDNRTSFLLTRISKLGLLSDIALAVELGSIPKAFGSFVSTGISDMMDRVAINCSALAIDGYRISCTQYDALKSCINSSHNDTSTSVPLRAGLTFQRLEDIGESVQHAFIENWSSLACLGLSLIVDSSQHDDTTSQKVRSWLSKLIPVIISGLLDDLEVIDPKAPAGLKAVKSCTIFLLALRKFMNSGLQCEFISSKDMDVLVMRLFKFILFPSLAIPYIIKICDEKNEEEKEPITIESCESWIGSISVVSQACDFIRDICGEGTIFTVNVNAVLEKQLFLMSKVEEGFLTFESDHEVKDIILSSCLTSIQMLLSRCDIRLDLDQVLLSFTLSHLIVKESQMICFPLLHRVTGEILQYCTKSERITDQDKHISVCVAAKNGNWEAWGLLCSCIDQSQCLSSSLGPLRSALENVGDVSGHFSALTAVCKEANRKNEMIPFIMGGVGSDILRLFQLYGVCKLANCNRVSACAMCVKLIMIAFEHMMNDVNSENMAEIEENVTQYFSVIFVTIVSVLSFNGLPNRILLPSGGQQADPAIGRICAQLLVYVMRMSPEIFKKLIVILVEDHRTIVETAIRADMTGYKAKKSNVPIKKKLNLSSFKK